MPNRARKFRTVHKFGKRRRKRAVQRKDAPELPVTSDDLIGPADLQTPRNSGVTEELGAAQPEEAIVTADGVGARPVLRKTSVPFAMLTADREHTAHTPTCGAAVVTGACATEMRTRPDRARIDTAYLTAVERDQIELQAREKIAELSSVSATERKVKCLTSEPRLESASTKTYTIVDLDMVNCLLKVAGCRVCGGALTIERDSREYGIAVKLKVLCSNCGEIDTKWSSQRVGGTANCNPFEINVLAARAVQSTGNGQTVLNDIFAAIGVSHRGLHNKTYQHYLKSKLNPAATSACTENMAKCATSVKNVYRSLNFGNAGNIAVSFDGTWHTRGHSSHIGVATVIELFSGYVLDYVVLSNFCLGCELGPKPGTPDYAHWKSQHSCQKNTSSKAGQMEVEAALILFQRSLSLHGLRYTTMLSDGDSRSYSAIDEAEVYGFIPVEKEDCANHVQKRMGTALRNLVQKQKGENGERISGKGRLTGDLINKLTSYYGWALKSHSGNVDEMHTAVWATYYHVTSTDEKPNHSFCPHGPYSWCKYNAAIAKNEPPPKSRYNLPYAVSNALRPVYERLSDKKLLQRCQRGKTQNANESLHSIIWSLVPKEKNASLFAVEAAVAEAVMRFNLGSHQSSSHILSELHVQQTCAGSRRASEKDSRRVANADRKRTSSAAFQEAIKKRHKEKPASDYSPGAF